MNKKIIVPIAITITMLMSVIPIQTVEAASKTKKPAKVSNVKVSPIGTKAVKIQWKKTARAKQYQIFRSNKKNGKYKRIATVKKTTYTNKKLKTNTTYYYRVRAINGKQHGQYSSKVVGKTTNKAAKPTGIKAKSSNTSSVKVSWKKANNAKGYQVYRTTKKNGKYVKVGTIKKGSKLTFTDKKLKANTTYYYKMRSVRGKKVSKFSKVVKVKTQKAPTKPNPTDAINLAQVNRDIATVTKNGGTIDKSSDLIGNNNTYSYYISSNTNKFRTLRIVDVGYVDRYFNATPFTDSFRIKIRNSSITAYYTTDGSIPSPKNGIKLTSKSPLVRVTTDSHLMDVKVHGYVNGKLVVMQYYYTDGWLTFG